MHGLERRVQPPRGTEHDHKVKAFLQLLTSEDARRAGSIPRCECSRRFSSMPHLVKALGLNQRMTQVEVKALLQLLTSEDATCAVLTFAGGNGRICYLFKPYKRNNSASSPELGVSSDSGMHVGMHLVHLHHRFPGCETSNFVKCWKCAKRMTSWGCS